MPKQDEPPFRIAFLHLDLGIGGAEQLIVSAALALQERGRDVIVYTTHHDPSYCFRATTGDGALASRVLSYGDWLPRQVLRRFTALCATVRMLYLALVVILLEGGVADAIVVDGVSAPIPLLRLAGLPVLFYCHFPDKLLCVDRSSGLKALYRAPLDWLEQWTTAAASVVAVNSRFTAGVFREAFPALRKLAAPVVLYPPVELNSSAVRPGLDDTTPTVMAVAAANSSSSSGRSSRGGSNGHDGNGQPPAKFVMVSLNRFERKKNVGLAIRALAAVRSALDDVSESADSGVTIAGAAARIANNGVSNSRPQVSFKDVLLVVAGGYDPRVAENVEHRAELERLAADLGLEGSVSFRPSISDAARAALLRDASCVLYTPDREHFGIVPLEAMHAGAPVVAVASGGPLESVIDGRTGFLCRQTPAAFAAAVLRLAQDPALAWRMGRAGHAHVRERFSAAAFGAAFDGVLREMVAGAGGRRQRGARWRWPALAVSVAVTAAAVMALSYG